MGPTVTRPEHDPLAANSSRINYLWLFIGTAANDRVVNEIIKPKATNCIVIGTPDGDLTEEPEVAVTFNKFFIDSILMTSIDTKN